ncbi:MAG: amidohydrolase family protein [Lentisphaeria bacterium]|nr:amidohydrolase family protein [Lentisphaeria bacterium]
MKKKFTNVLIADGSGNSPFYGELLICGNYIAEVGTAISCKEKHTIIDGNGLCLAPGWIDTHGHSDISLLASPGAFGKISQGITTEICGNCGLSAFPLNENNRGHLQELYAQYRMELHWGNGASYRAGLPENTMRQVSLCGHNTLRAAAAGYQTRKLSRGQLDLMCQLLDAELAGGAAGLSSGLLYTPGCFADQEEITRLLEVVAKHNKIYALHLRSEGNQLLESLEETSTAALSAGLKRLMISHFKTAGPANFHKLDAALDWFEKSRQKGIMVWCDRYPWCESQTQLSIVVPESFGVWDDSTLKELLQNADHRNALKDQLRRSGRNWSNVRLVWTQETEFQKFAGQSFKQLSEAFGTAPEELAVRLLCRDAAGCTAAFRGMSPENLRRILQQDFCCCGTDESARPEDYTIGRSHPRGFGAMPRFFRLLRELGFSTGEAVRRMSGLPSEIFQLHDRGKLEKGRLADLVLFDPEKYDSTADFSHPHTAAQGVAGVWIGGRKIL